MNNLKDRIQTHSTISKKLAAISDDELSVLLATGEVFHSGWGKSLLLNIDGTKIFVKKIPVTNLELLPENIMSTANLFDLPTYYQYGVGSAGFGIWRELAAHITTTNWVISGECKNFPIMYHWRTMVGSPNILNIDHWGSFENYYKYWENSNAIRKRVEALNTASSHILLFLEYVPHNLYQWLNDQFSEGVSSAESAIIFIDNNLKTINHFINSHGLLHFDAHFENILTDGKLIYFSDFGLALSTKFDLSAKEIEFSS